MPIKSVTKKFAFSKDEVINLILDIDKYKEFLPWCKNSYIVEKKENDLVKTISANLEIGYKQFADTYTSLVTLDKNKSEISVKHLNGPLKKLNNIWKFKELSKKSCEVNFYIEIELDNFILNKIFEKFFNTGFEKNFLAFQDRVEKKLK